jgi:hypothetical protein
LKWSHFELLENIQSSVTTEEEELFGNYFPQYFYSGQRRWNGRIKLKGDLFS